MKKLIRFICIMACLLGLTGIASAAVMSDFTLQVSRPVPEPASMLLIGAGLFVLAGLVMLILTYVTLENQSAKKRIGFFTLGFSTIVLGLLMFVFDAIVTVSPYIFLTLAILSWVAGPILMLIGFYVTPTTTTPKTPKPIATLEPQTLDPT